MNEVTLSTWNASRTIVGSFLVEYIQAQVNHKTVGYSSVEEIKTQVTPLLNSAVERGDISATEVSSVLTFIDKNLKFLPSGLKTVVEMDRFIEEEAMELATTQNATTEAVTLYNQYVEAKRAYDAAKQALEDVYIPACTKRICEFVGKYHTFFKQEYVIACEHLASKCK